MEWSEVGEWLVDNASTGGALVGSLMTGNVYGAVAAGAALVQSATGETKPEKAMAILQNNPDAMVRLRELEVQDDENVRAHLRTMTELKLKDGQASHETTQQTIRNGDDSDKWWVSATRPGQSWVSLAAAIAYVFLTDNPDVMILGALLTLPWSYAGLRQVGKGIDAFTVRKSTPSKD